VVILCPEEPDERMWAELSSFEDLLYVQVRLSFVLVVVHAVVYALFIRGAHQVPHS